MRDLIWSKRIADYVLKEGIQNVDYIIQLLERLHKNKQVKVLIVDDSIVLRNLMERLLTTHRYQVLTARHGIEALHLLKDNTDVQLMIVDYNMPQMNGFELVKAVRAEFSKEDLAIIGISAEGGHLLSAKFIKHGANDFLNKPFVAEEFYCRITHNIEMLDHLRFRKESANVDYLTKLYNRMYFFDLGRKIFSSCSRGEASMAIAMVDIDHFKRINDTYGHDAGDIVLQYMANLLNNRFRESDIVARFGGEEFCVLLNNPDMRKIDDIFEGVRSYIEASEVTVGKHKIKITVSMGVCTRLFATLDQMIKKADVLLYEAKQSGRNRVVTDL